jgi:DnaK suppressor protein
MSAKDALSAADLQRFRARLIEERARVLSDLEYTEEEIAELQQQTASEHQDEEIGGGASFTLDREIDRALDDNAERALAAIEAALGRIEGGTYGLCTNCGKPISPGRLEARPYAGHCLECARG